MATETKSGAPNPEGLYKDPESGQHIGALDPIQADAMVQQGYQLVKEGREAAMTTQADLDELAAPKKETPATKQETSEGQAPDASDSPEPAKKSPGRPPKTDDDKKGE